MELAPNSDDGYRRLSSAYRSVGRRDEAIQAALKTVEINPYSANNHTQVGNVYYHYGMNDKAMAAFRKVIELEPDNAAGHNSIGAVYMRESKWQDSIPAFQKAVELRPFWRYFSNQGVAYFYMGNYAQAAAMFEKAADMNGNEQLVVGNLADAYRWLGDRNKASKTYDRAIGLAYKAYQVNPRDAANLGSLALYYAKKGDVSLALEFIRRARSINKDETALMYKEALVFALTGKPDEALNALRQTLTHGYSVQEAKNDPELTSLRTRPEFGQLLAEFERRR